MKPKLEINPHFQIPLVLHSFRQHIDANPNSNSNSFIHPHHRPQQISNHQHEPKSSSQSRLMPQTSRKKLELGDITVCEHYENMQKILLNQNLNLKSQNKYLTSQIRKSFKRQQKLKQKHKQLSDRLKKCSEDINKLEEDYLNTKTILQQQLEYLASGVKTNNYHELKNIVSRFIDEIINQLRLDVDLTFLDKQPLQDDLENKEINKIDIDNQIELLTKQLEKLISSQQNEGRTTEVRRECIEISKKLKQLKQQSRLASNISVPSSFASEAFQDYNRPNIPNWKSAGRERKLLERSASIREPETYKYGMELQSSITQRRSVNRQPRPSIRSKQQNPVILKAAKIDSKLK